VQATRLRLARNYASSVTCLQAHKTGKTGTLHSLIVRHKDSLSSSFNSLKRDLRLLIGEKLRLICNLPIAAQTRLAGILLRHIFYSHGSTINFFPLTVRDLSRASCTPCSPPGIFSTLVGTIRPFASALAKYSW
jgi:hypothetical protein